MNEQASQKFPAVCQRIGNSSEMMSGLAWHDDVLFHASSRLFASSCSQSHANLPASMAGTSRSRSASVSTTYDSGIRKTTTTSRPYTGKSRPRTAATSTGYGDNEIICAITGSRGISPTIGLSFVNLTTTEAVLCQFADTQTYARTCHKLKVFNPTEIIYMSTAAESKLLSILNENLEVDKFDILMTSIDRRYWSESTGFEYVQHLAFPDDLESLKVSVGGNYFATCCFAAVG